MNVTTGNVPAGACGGNPADSDTVILHPADGCEVCLFRHGGVRVTFDLGPPPPTEDEGRNFTREACDQRALLLRLLRNEALLAGTLAAARAGLRVQLPLPDLHPAAVPEALQPTQPSLPGETAMPPDVEAVKPGAWVPDMGVPDFSLPLHVPLKLCEVEMGGVLRVGNTRVSLDVVIAEHLKGTTPEGIVAAYDTLKLPDVFAVLAWYHGSREAVDAYLARRRKAADILEALCVDRSRTDGSLARLREAMSKKRREALQPTQPDTPAAPQDEAVTLTEGDIIVHESECGVVNFDLPDVGAVVGEGWRLAFGQRFTAEALSKRVADLESVLRRILRRYSQCSAPEWAEARKLLGEVES